MLYRLRARLRFPASSGMATWARDQMAVRYGMAVHINEGLAHEEPKYNRLLDEGTTHVFECDLPLMNEAHAADAYATLTDGSVWEWLSKFREEILFVEWHNCYHDEIPMRPCEVVSRKEE